MKGLGGRGGDRQMHGGFHNKKNKIERESEPGREDPSLRLLFTASDNLTIAPSASATFRRVHPGPLSPCNAEVGLKESGSVGTGVGDSSRRWEYRSLFLSALFPR